MLRITYKMNEKIVLGGAYGQQGKQGSMGRSVDGNGGSSNRDGYERKGYMWMTDHANVEHYFYVPSRN